MWEKIRPTINIKQSRNLRTNSNQDIYYCDSGSHSRANQEIYSIKNATNGKTEEEIKRLIRGELDLEEDDIHLWNRMILLISRFRLSDGIKQFKNLTNFSFYTYNLIENMWLDEIGDKDNKAMQEITQDESLSSRTKGKRLTYEEKKEIQLKIRQGTPIREIRELYQLSLSTI